nr:protocadherin Fat 4 [Ciona intestinalis]|eukprot:XP_002124308.4 protocadherin Fat 4 [Ciona intestinalis]
MATDVGPISSRQRTYSDVIIEVLDVNDNTPQLIIPSQIYIGEDTVPGDSVFKVGAIDADISDTNFAFSMTPDDSAFSIDPYTGQVSVANVLNIDITRKYNISIQVQERDISNPFSSSQNFEIILLDANNHAPLFTTPPGGYSARISEDLPVGSLVINIEARDMDDGLNGKVKYKIVGFDKPDQLFTVDAYTGSIYLVGNLDYEQTPNHLVTIEACDQGNPPLCSMMNITVELDDVNDMPPVVLPSSTTVELMEGITNVIVAQLTASDGDTSEGGNVDFRNIVVVAVDNDDVSTTISDSPFTLSHDGVVMLVGSINREEVRHYSLVVTAVDRGQPTLTGTASIIVKVGDKNEFPPVFQPVSYRVNISEDVDVGTPVVTVATVDRDAGDYGVVRYSISNIENVPFVINPSTGLISTRSRLDRETQGSYILQVVASDSQVESNRRTSTTEVMITLDDENDNPPMFEDLVYEFYTHTSVSQCGVVFASDADIGFNGDVTYSIIPTLAFLPFNIHQQTGVITSTSTLTSPIYNFTITASDGGVPALTSSTNVLIRTTNAAKPVFTQSPTTPVSIHENSPMDGNIIAEFQATTARVGAGNIEYFLRGGNLYNSFSLDRNTGQLVLNNNLDFEKTSSFHLIVEAQDTGLPPVSSLANLTINVVDRNDNPPIFTKHLYTGHVLENGATNQVITAVLASDLDTGRGCMVRYSLRRDEDSDKFQIDPNVGTIRNLVSFDREEKQSYFLTVVAKDEGSPVLSTTTGVHIIIEDINDESPFFTKLISATVREDAAIGDYVIQVTSTDKDSEQFSMNRYRLRNNENQTFSINPLSGWVVVNKLLDAETQQLYQLEVEVYDDAWSTHTSIHINVININDNPPRFTTSSQVVDVPTHTTSGTQLTIVSAVDADVGPRQNIVYKMETPNDLLHIDQLSGEVFANQDLTCSLTPGYKDSCPYTTTTTISASDTGSPPLSSSMILTIHIRPPNLHPPVFQTPTSTIALLRTSPIGTQAATIHATDDDHNSILSYQISGQHSSYFTINETTGLITTTRNIGFNSRSKLNIVVTATDNGIPPRFSERNLQFEVSETNSYGPNFSRHLFTASSLPENSRIGRKVFVAQALDNDLGINGEVWYSFDNIVDSSKPFSIDANNGSIVTTQALDYEEVQSYSLTIIATDRSVSPRSTHATLIIPITDVDDNPPKFNSSCYIGYIPENSPPETVIMRLSAMDIDTGENAIIQYSVHPQQLILVRSLTGDIYTSPGTALDYETQNSFHLTVTAESDSLTSPPSSLIIQVTGINEFKPQLVSSTLNLVSSVTGNQGKVIGRLEATDPDGGQDGKISFYLAGWSEGLGFVVNSTTGDISVSQGAMLTLGEQISLTVFVKNPGLSNSSDISQASVVVTVVTDECIRSPCMNGAVCEDRINTFACVCAPGYSGSVCETEIDECSSNPCLNGGSCADQVASFTCVCAPGYTGHTCDTDIDYCQDEPCFNGGSCIDGILTHTCVCQFGTTGRNCEVNSLGFEPLSYLGMPTLNSQSNTIFLEFATVSSSALILYNHGGNSSALFVAMELLRGTLRVSYSFNNIRIYRHSVGTNLNNGIFHSVRFTLSQSGASINVDNCLITNDIAGDCSITVAHTPHEPLLDLSTQPLYIGGVPHVQDILDHPGQVSSMDYVGCIRSMVINSMSIYSVSSHFIDQSSGVTDGCVRSNSTSGVGCVEDTCGAGQCTDAWSDVICDCPVGTAGKNCKEKQIGTTFSGSNYLSFAFQPSYVRESLLATSGALYSGGNRKKRSTQVIESSVEITFRTRMSGLLLFINSTSNDFISLYVNKSDVYFHYETSSGVEVQKVEASVSDGAWHSVRLQATQVAGAATFNLSLDGISKLYESFMGKITAFTDPSLVQNIYVGGAPETLSNTWSPLNGCILHFLLNDQQQPLSYDITSGLLVLEQTVGSSSTMPGCRGNDVCASNPCPHDQYCNDIWEKFECIPLGGCASSPCLNQASCIPFNNGSYACSCSTYYMGNLCETYIPCLMVDCSTKGTNQVCVSNGLPGGTTCACKSGYFDLNDFCVPVSVATAGIGWWAYVVIGLVGLLVFALAIWCVRRRYFNLEQKGENGNLQNRKKLQTITPKLNGNNTNGRNNSSYEFDTITRTQLPSLPRPDILSEDVLIVDEEAFSNYAECHNDVCDDSPTPQIADHNDNIPNTEEEANKRSSPLPTYSVVMNSRGPPTLPPMYESERDSNLEQAYKTTQGLNHAYNTTQGLNNAYKTTTSPPLSIISSSSIARPSPPSSRSSTSQHRISDRMGASPPPRMPLLKHKPPVHADQPTNTLKQTPSRTRHVSGSAASSTTTTSSISQDNIQPASIEDMVQHLNGLVGLTREEIELLNENPGNPPSYPSSTTGSVMSSYPPSVEPPRSRKPSALQGGIARPSSLPGRRIDRIHLSGRSRTPMMMPPSYEMKYKIPLDLQPSQFLQPPDTSSDEEDFDSFKINSGCETETSRVDPNINLEKLISLGPHKYEALAAVFADLSMLPRIDETESLPSKHVVTSSPFHNMTSPTSSVTSYQSKHRISFSSGSNASGSRTSSRTGHGQRTRQEHYV